MKVLIFTSGGLCRLIRNIAIHVIYNVKNVVHHRPGRVRHTFPNRVISCTWPVFLKKEPQVPRCLCQDPIAISSPTARVWFREFLDVERTWIWVIARSASEFIFVLVPTLPEVVV